MPWLLLLLLLPLLSFDPTQATFKGERVVKRHDCICIFCAHVKVKEFKTRSGVGKSRFHSLISHYATQINH